MFPSSAPQIPSTNKSKSYGQRQIISPHRAAGHDTHMPLELTSMATRLMNITRHSLPLYMNILLSRLPDLSPKLAFIPHTTPRINLSWGTLTPFKKSAQPPAYSFAQVLPRPIPNENDTCLYLRIIWDAACARHCAETARPTETRSISFLHTA